MQNFLLKVMFFIFLTLESKITYVKEEINYCRILLIVLLRYEFYHPFYYAIPEIVEQELVTPTTAFFRFARGRFDKGREASDTMQILGQRRCDRADL